MKRRWLRLLVAYLMGGYIASWMIVMKLPAGSGAAFFTIKSPSRLVVSSIFWPIACLVSLRRGAAFSSVAWACAEFLVPCFICYRALRHFVPKPLKYRFCPACGHDLRASPENGEALLDHCPQCETVAAHSESSAPTR
jgi:hypothetical protein